MSRIQREKKTISAMLNIYCSDHHGAQQAICDDCRQLLDYACSRLDNCPFSAAKPACNKCTVHCYSRSMRERVRQVMRYSGPRMILRHPLLAVGHIVDRIREAPVLSAKKNRS